jgi:hypothetical protein
VTDSLPVMIDRLAGCPKEERIELRTDVLAFGGDAVKPLLDLATRDSSLGATVGSWLEVLAKTDQSSRASAIAGLRVLATSNDDGRLAQASLERLGAVPTRAAPSTGSRTIPTAAGTEWTGFAAHEFGRNAETSWRSAEGRTSLAPILARVLRGLARDFISFGVERSPEIHFALSRRYKSSPESGFTSSKLIVYAHGPTDERPQGPAEVVTGYYIERGDGSDPYGDPFNPIRWDWPLFLAAPAGRTSSSSSPASWRPTSYGSATTSAGASLALSAGSRRSLMAFRSRSTWQAASSAGGGPQSSSSSAECPPTSGSTFTSGERGPGRRRWILGSHLLHGNWPPFLPTSPACISGSSRRNPRRSDLPLTRRVDIDPDRDPEPGVRRARRQP